MENTNSWCSLSASGLGKTADFSNDRPITPDRMLQPYIQSFKIPAPDLEAGADRACFCYGDALYIIYLP
jgi:hypothetical protein